MKTCNMQFLYVTEQFCNPLMEGARGKAGDKFITSDVMNWLLVNSEFERYPALPPENNDVQ